MNDNEIIELYWNRSEIALVETSQKYSKYCHYISYNILRNNEDAEECVNDTYYRAWNAIPPKRPNNLATFLGKITRNLSLNKYKNHNTQKRGGGQTELALAELEGCIPSIINTEQLMDEKNLVEAINAFLLALPKTDRIVFVRRYWYLSSIQEISSEYSMSISKVKSMLLRSRSKLKKYLEKEGIII